MKIKKNNKYTVIYWNDGWLMSKDFIDETYSRVVKFACSVKAEKIYNGNKQTKWRYRK